ncbi:hypothetical protein HYPSUDRAFT_1044067 [Hypholoma sublateritium FD-334 SS-4]|uniref:Uncharacterized protein n=1 Tax=Hypholoma sublateritium (strain FD-334 SS-4) TaxID=945553 RepID=A0A0D2KR39_HYPSF|nr:hypothetical protein HYPSUDRAFT_1044067 [Hypholoma sublateritium FD-334 SS-4]
MRSLNSAYTASRSWQTLTVISVLFAGSISPVQYSGAPGVSLLLERRPQYTRVGTQYRLYGWVCIFSHELRLHKFHGSTRSEVLCRLETELLSLKRLGSGSFHGTRPLTGTAHTFILGQLIRCELEMHCPSTFKIVFTFAVQVPNFFFYAGFQS